MSETVLTIDQRIEETKAVKDARSKLDELNGNLDAAIAELQAERPKAAQAVLDGTDPDKANKRIILLTARVETLREAATLADQRIEQAQAAEAEKIRAAAQKKVDALRKKTEKSIDELKASMEAVKTSYNATMELWREAIRTANETGADGFDVSGMGEFWEKLFPVYRQADGMKVK